jgi:CheY-like chemotaxis protein
MKTILLVDDELLLCEALAEAVRQLPGGTPCEAIVAESGARAIECLSRRQIDLVVTDLCMPQVDGFKLLDHLGRHHPCLPVVAMTGYGFPEVDQFVQNLGARLFFEKPIDLHTLLTAIEQLLHAGEESSIQGFSLPSFLQMVELDKKSSLVQVRAGAMGQVSGQLAFLCGQLIHANAAAGSERWQGEPAVTEMLAWRDPQLRVSHLGQVPPRNVFTPLSTLLMESAHAFDEKAAAGNLH